MKENNSSNDWQVVRLEDIADVILGGTPPTKVDEYWEPAEIDWVTAKDISNFPVAKISYTERKISRKGLENSSAKILPALTTVIIARGATMGKVRMLARPMAINQTCYGIVAKKGEVDPRFLYYYLRNLYRELRNVAHGSVFDTVTISTLNPLEIRLPPLSRQRSIARLLGTLDDKIELNQRMNATLEAIARVLFKSWFVDFDPVRIKLDGQDTGLPTEVAGFFPDGFEDSDLGKIPVGWRVGKLGEIARNPRRTVKPKEIANNVPYIGLGNMPQQSISLSEWKMAEDVHSNKYEFHKGEILFGKLRPYFHKVGIAPIDGICSTDILVISPKNRSWYGLVLGYFSSRELVNFATAASTGTKMPRTNWRDLSNFEIVVPPVDLVHYFSHVVLKPITEAILNNIHQTRVISQLRDTLLPKLIRSEILISPNMGDIEPYGKEEENEN